MSQFQLPRLIAKTPQLDEQVPKQRARTEDDPSCPGLIVSLCPLSRADLCPRRPPLIAELHEAAQDQDLDDADRLGDGGCEGPDLDLIASLADA